MGRVKRESAIDINRSYSSAVIFDFVIRQRFDAGEILIDCGVSVGRGQKRGR